MKRSRMFPTLQKALPLFFFGMIAAVPFATFGAIPKTRAISTAADIQIVANIGNHGETR